MRARAKELKAAEDGETAVRAALAKMAPADRAMGTRLHAIVTKAAPDLVPNRQGHAGPLDHAEGPRKEPDVEVRAAVAPAVQVDPCDVAEREDRALDPCRHPTEVGLQLIRQVAEGVHMDAAGEPNGAGKASTDRRMQRPVLVRPDRL